MNMIYELSPYYENVKSYYGKATILDKGNKKVLFSYNTRVCTLDNEGYKLKNVELFSNTTCRHVREFLRQAGYPAMSKKEIIENSKQIESEV